MSITYQWSRCDAYGVNCADVSGATGPNYVLAAADLGSTIRVTVDDGVSTATSVPTAIIGGVTPPAGSILWNGNFDTGDTSQYRGVSGNGGMQQKAADRSAIVTSPVRSGTYALRMTCKPGDFVNSTVWERCEILLPQEESGGYEGTDSWWAWSTYYPSTTPHQGGSNQFHPTGAGGPGQTGVKAESMNLYVVVFGDQHVPLFDPGSPTRSYQDTMVPTMSTDTWYDQVLHIKWSTNYNVGLVETFVNGARTSPLVNCVTLFSVDRGVYFKFGIYRAPQTFTETIVFNGAIRANTYAAAISQFPSGWPAVAPP